MPTQFSPTEATARKKTAGCTGGVWTCSTFGDLIRAKCRRSLSPASRCPDQGKPLAFDDLIGRHFRSHRIAKPQIGVSLALWSMGGSQVEPFIGKNGVWRHAVALVIAQAEPALRKGVTLRGRSLVEIGGGVVGLRHTEAIFVHEAETRLRPGISAQRHGRQLVDRPNVIAPGIGSSPARQPVGVRDRHRVGAEQQNGKQNSWYGPPHWRWI